MPYWSSAGMAHVAEIVRRRSGLVFPGSRIADVEAAVRRSMARSGVSDPDQLVTLLDHDAAARDALVAEVTVGESYFQRDPAQFEFLRRHAIPALLGSRSGAVRVWSAGCAAGEEPYTVAMLFDELGALDRAEIVGTDISRPRLADAHKGVYSRWALRNTDDDARRRYFRERGRYFELLRRIRNRVQFRYLNLAEDEFPSFSTGIWGMDIILCRNVLIYFDEATVERVAHRLLATLSDDGWLVLGASDPPISHLIPCDVVMTDSGMVYRRSTTARSTDLRTWPERPVTPPLGAPDEAYEYEYEPEAPEAPSTPDTPLHFTADPAWVQHAPAANIELPEQALPEKSPSGEPEAPEPPEPPEPPQRDPAEQRTTLLDAYSQRDFDSVCRLAESVVPALTAAEYIAWLRALANRGQLDAAREVNARAVTACGETAELLYLDAVLLLEAGRPEDAAAAARKALYLDRELAVAHLALANARQRLQDRAGARRSLHNAAALLERLPPDAAVRAADGEIASRLAELVKMNLHMLES